MNIYSVKYQDRFYLVNEDLKLLRINKPSNIAAIWRSSDGKKWEGKDLRKDLRIKGQLSESGIYAPGKIVFLLTSKCNLKCIYCYSRKSSEPYTIKFENCKRIIDRVVELHLKRGKQKLKIKFHGGGEPFSEFELMKQIANYSKIVSVKYNLKLRIEVSSNGILNDEIRWWIINNVNRLSLSFDGHEEFQRLNRPSKLKRIDSYAEICKTIRYFDSHDYCYSLRVTLVKSNQEYFQKIADGIQSLTEKANVKIELAADIRDQFFKFNRGINFQEFLYAYGNLKASIPNIVSSFDACDVEYGQCGAWGDNLIIDGSNNISTCFKYSGYGEMSPFYITDLKEFLEQEIVVDENHILNRITNNLRSECSYCFLWKKCNGSCLAMYRDEKYPNCNSLRTFFIKKVQNEGATKSVCESIHD